jgi:hypothetical protein
MDHRNFHQPNHQILERLLILWVSFKGLNSSRWIVVVTWTKNSDRRAKNILNDLLKSRSDRANNVLYRFVDRHNNSFLEAAFTTAPD